MFLPGYRTIVFAARRGADTKTSGNMPFVESKSIATWLDESRAPAGLFRLRCQSQLEYSTSQAT